jgi:hypothetical protein
MRFLFAIALFFATLLTAPGLARAQPVDLLLVLMVDASGSIDPEEFRFQRDGYADAISDPRLVRAIISGRRGSIAVAFVEWGTPGGASTLIDWRRIHDQASAEAFADEISTAPRTPQSYNALGDGIVHSANLIQTSGIQAERAIIDVSGDGPDNRSRVPVTLARDAAIANGITINALVVVKAGSGTAGRADMLVDHYRNEVIGGPGAFVVVARDYPDFAAAIYSKLIREIAENNGSAPSAAEIAP